MHRFTPVVQTIFKLCTQRGAGASCVVKVACAAQVVVISLGHEGLHALRCVARGVGK